MGYVGAFLTGIYTFRLIFRAFFGKPCPEAECEHRGRSSAPRRRASTRVTGELEDHRRRLPGTATTTIAERNWTMKIPMGILGAAGAGCRHHPGPRHRQTSWHQASWRRQLRHLEVLYDAGSERPAPPWVGLVIGGVIADQSASRHRVPCSTSVSPAPLSATGGSGIPALHTFLYNKWYFDEVIDLLIVRPVQMSGRLHPHHRARPAN